MAGHHNLHLVLTDRRIESASFGRRSAQSPLPTWLRTYQPNIVVLGGVAGMIVGVLIWGYLAMSLIAGIDSLLGETEPRLTAVERARSAVFDCASFGAVRALAAEDEARFQAQCGTSAQPVSQPEPAPVLPAQPVASATNRANCDQIRGTDYWSGEERTWYLDNCAIG